MTYEIRQWKVIDDLIKKANEIYIKGISNAKYIQISNKIIEGIAKECGVSNEEAINILENFLNTL